MSRIHSLCCCFPRPCLLADPSIAGGLPAAAAVFRTTPHADDTPKRFRNRSPRGSPASRRRSNRLKIRTIIRRVGKSLSPKGSIADFILQRFAGGGSTTPWCGSTASDSSWMRRWPLSAGAPPPYPLLFLNRSFHGVRENSAFPRPSITPQRSFRSLTDKTAISWLEVITGSSVRRCCFHARFK